MNEFRQRSSLAVALACTLALAACGNSETPPPAAAPAPPPAATPAPTPPPAPAPAPNAVGPVTQVTVISLGSSVGADGKITSPATVFKPKDTIYAVIATDSTAPGTITIRWSFQGSQVVNEQVQSLPSVGPSVTTAHINKPDGFPAGSYSLDVLVDGKSISATPFTVQ